MKQKKHLIRHLMLLAAMLFSITASAYDFEVDGIYYTIKSTFDLTVSASGLADSTIVELAIPETVSYKTKTLRVTSVGAMSFAECKNLISLIIPPSVTTIGNYAFYKCTSLDHVKLSEGVSTIGSSCFEGCWQLVQCSLPQSTSSIGGEAFWGTSIEKLYIPNNCDTIGPYAFAKMENLREVSLPSTLRTLPYGCFSGCSKLQKISLPTSLLYIHGYALANCTSLQELQLPQSLKSLGNNVLYRDSLVEKLVIPDSVTDIGFYNYAHLKSITFGADLSGLPFEYYQDLNTSNYSYSKHWRTIGSYGYIVTKNTVLELKKDENLCNNVEEVIIANCDKSFGMRGFQRGLSESSNGYYIPPFSNCAIKYFYVGRPLSDIQKWESNGDDFHIPSNVSQGYGHIAHLEIAGFCTSVPYFYQRIDSLTLGDNVVKFNACNIYMDSINSVRCMGAIPPRLDNYKYIPTSTYTDATVYVPMGTKDVYMNAEGWRNFWNFEEYDVTAIGITEISTEQPSHSTIYDLQGRKLSEPQKGINIINGKKILVK